MSKKGILISCYGCGYAGCSMCCVYNCTSETEAIKRFIKQYGIRKLLRSKISRRK